MYSGSSLSHLGHDLIPSPTPVTALKVLSQPIQGQLVATFVLLPWTVFT